MTRIWKYRFYYYLAIPGLLYFLIFHYVPMGGALIAFKDISPFDGLGGFFDVRHQYTFITSSKIQL